MPGGVPLDVATVMFELLPVVGLGLKLAVGPDGWLLALKETEPVKPPFRVIVTA